MFAGFHQCLMQLNSNNYNLIDSNLTVINPGTKLQQLDGAQLRND